MRYIVFETDARQKIISKHLESKGCEKITKKDILQADFILLPFARVEQYVSFNDDFFSNLKKDVVVFTGAKNAKLKEKFQMHNINFVEMLTYEHMSILNSVPTAEGVLYNLLKDLDTCIFSSKILVLGYGVCGREISRKLKILGSEVEIYDRTAKKYAMANIFNIKYVSKKEIQQNKYDAIINTIPSHVLNKEEVQNIDKNTLIYDIASSPYGFDECYLKEIELKYKILKSLPSVFGLQFSGENSSNFIYNYMKGEME